MLERTDIELVEAARHGDVDSLGELYRRHYAAVVGIALCRVSDHHLAEDAVQETFAIACRDLGRLRRAESFGRWISGICRKVASRLAKSKSRYRLVESQNLAADGNPGDDRSDLIRQSVQRLSRSAREVIMLHYFSGLSHKQIASTLGISPHAVHGRLIRGRRKIAEDLRRTGLGRRKQ